MSGIGTPAVPSSGGGGGGSVTQGTTPWVDNITQIGGVSFSLGQALATASLPVVLTASQLSTLTPPSNTGYALDSSLSTIDTDLKSNITLHAGSALIGKVGIDQTTPGTTNAVAIEDGAGNALTSNSTTYTAKKALDANILGTLGTAFSTAGKVDVKAADGDVFVRSNAASTFPTQATLQTQTDTVMIGGVNIKEINAVTPLMGNGTTGTGSLRVTIASDNTAFSVNSTLSAETTKVIGVVRIAGNAGQILDSAVGASTAPANMIAVGGLYNSTEISPTTGQSAALQLDSKGRLRQVIMDAAGNTRGANVNSSNQLSVSVDAITALNTGTNSIGKISDITTSVVPGTGATNLGKAEDAAHTSGDTGVAAWGVRNDNLATTFGNDQDYGPLATDLNGRVMVAQKAATATLTNVSTSGTSATLLAANSSRIGATITNDAATVLYTKFGTTASATSYTVTLAGAASAPFSYYEVPAGYTGKIDGILASSTGNARVTEIT